MMLAPPPVRRARTVHRPTFAPPDPRSSAAPVAVYLIVPPYQALQPARPGSLARRAQARGTVAAVPLPRGPASLERLRACVAPLRHELPAAAWIALAPRDAGSDALAWAQYAPAVGLRAVLVEGSHPADALRPVMCDTARLPESVVEWLDSCRVPLSPNLAYVVRTIFAGAARHAELGPLLRERGLSEHGTRERFRKKGLPLPKRWHQAARALHAAIALQRHPTRCVLDLALELGYSSDAALSRQLHQAFGVRPVQVRGTLGWEWLLHAWLHRPPPRPGTRDHPESRRSGEPRSLALASGARGGETGLFG
jgi:AraC-like DNA-binding protein